MCILLSNYPIIFNSNMNYLSFKCSLILVLCKMMSDGWEFHLALENSISM